MELHLVDDAVLLSHGSVPTLHMSLGILSQLLVLLSGVGLGTCLILHKYGFLLKERVFIMHKYGFSLRIRCCLQVVLDSSYKCVCMSGFWLDMGFGIVNYVGRGSIPLLTCIRQVV